MDHNNNRTMNLNEINKLLLNLDRQNHVVKSYFFNNLDHRFFYIFTPLMDVIQTSVGRENGNNK